MSARRTIRRSHVAIRQRLGFASECLLQFFGGHAFGRKFTVETRPKGVEQNRQQPEQQEPERAHVRAALQLRLRAARERLFGRLQVGAHDRDDARFVVGEDLVALIEFWEPFGGPAEQRRRNLVAPLILDAHVLGEELFHAFESFARQRNRIEEFVRRMPTSR